MLGPTYPVLRAAPAARSASERTQQCSAEIQPLAAGLLDQPYIGHGKRRGVEWTAATGGDSRRGKRLATAKGRREETGAGRVTLEQDYKRELGVHLGRNQRRPVQI